MYDALLSPTLLSTLCLIFALNIGIVRTKVYTKKPLWANIF